mgnify:CR=1 FL=1
METLLERGALMDPPLPPDDGAKLTPHQQKRLEENLLCTFFSFFCRILFIFIFISQLLFICLFKCFLLFIYFVFYFILLLFDFTKIIVFYHRSRPYTRSSTGRLHSVSSDMQRQQHRGR